MSAGDLFSGSRPLKSSAFPNMPFTSNPPRFGDAGESREVLDAIYPSELSIISDRQIEIDVEPDVVVDGAESFKLKLTANYTDDYPDALPALRLEVVDGEINESESKALLEGLLDVGEENKGMAMTFTLVSHLREKLTSLVENRVKVHMAEEHERERLAIEAEEARTRGTPVTIESFKAWKANFDKEMSQRKMRDEEEKLRALTPKEREEIKKIGTRLTGRQLFERNRNLEHEDDNLMEEGTVSVDFSQYDRTQALDEDNEDCVRFSDSD
ncbi:RWD-domain-containing protein [Boletus coccyginus]|nr:RWD-domain-containing protein [Boletus coccyginus]